MANDIFEKFTVGGLGNGNGRGASLMCFSGQILLTNPSVAASQAGQTPPRWHVSPDGVITSTNADAEALVMTHGSGVVELRFIDLDGTGTDAEGSVGQLSFYLGSTTDPDDYFTENNATTRRSVADSGHAHVIGAWAIGGFDIGGTTYDGTVNAAVDMIAPMGLDIMDSNKITFNIGAPYEQEGGTQIPIQHTPTLLKFSVIVLTASDGIISTDLWRGRHLTKSD